MPDSTPIATRLAEAKAAALRLRRMCEGPASEAYDYAPDAKLCNDFIIALAAHEAGKGEADYREMGWRERAIRLERELAAARAEIARLTSRILSAAGDDLCKLSQDEIKAYTSGAVQIPPKEIFLESCERFHQQIANEAGVLADCPTVAQLIAENERLRADEPARIAAAVQERDKVWTEEVRRYSMPKERGSILREVARRLGTTAALGTATEGRG